MQAQAKFMKWTWSTARGSGAGRVQFQGAEKRLAEGQEMDNLVVNAIQQVLKTNKYEKDTAAHGSVLEESPANFHFKNLSIGQK